MNLDRVPSKLPGSCIFGALGCGAGVGMGAGVGAGVGWFRRSSSSLQSAI